MDRGMAYTRNTFVLRFKQIQELIWRSKTAAKLQQKSQFSTLQVGQSTSRPREGLNPKGRAGLRERNGVWSSKSWVLKNLEIDVFFHVFSSM